MREVIKQYKDTQKIEKKRIKKKEAEGQGENEENEEEELE